MGPYSAKLGVSNRSKRAFIVWAEPYCEDYTLLPGESLEILARDELEQPWFHLDQRGDCVQVWIEVGSSDYDVVQNGIRLECGHQRPEAIADGHAS